MGLSIREFERECGLKRGNISNMTGALGSDKLSKIIQRFPSIDLYWLLTGRGNIFRDASDAGGKTNCEDEDLPLVIDSMVSNLTNYTELQLRQLKLLQKLIDQNKKERDPLQNR
ncbi:hypothetical protein GHJ49_11105 [Alistipes sp. dk3620]|uniref:HTH cro/C1-type domain-containing protein n=1 Tax=Alistipes hominis TaxID=2763015 RepID=A0ABR7CP61_9BACT|nr:MULTISPECIES: hypothetical protein [Alistipes]MBC5617125.1 hypothetical protein [Alistipes hominis]MQX28176.1 hypothetical protein [Alistipes sp. dk3620]RHR62491.1 hypothetical protein DWW79_09250 [Alistipes sp. AF17-16]HAY30595.1 hypothetical protein [Alistipes sp.]